MKLSKSGAQPGRAIARFTSSAAAVIFLAAASQNSQAIVFGQPDGHPNVGAMLLTFEGETFPICPSLNNWEDVGALVLEAESGADLPDPVTLAQPGFLDDFSKRQLHRAEFVAVGYGASLQPQATKSRWPL